MIHANKIVGMTKTVWNRLMNEVLRKEKRNLVLRLHGRGGIFELFIMGPFI